ncbi:MAG: glycosyltransferase family 39 protein [Bacteroidetes bacterium]|nr:glycosyltransferase family 39 protein [Bacteroidota bacterium]
MTVRTPSFFFFLYFLFLACLFYGGRLCPDSYYYLNWSQHLQLSYFDGPPLIAYVFRLYTAVFGVHEFSLFLFGLSTLAITAMLIWRTALLLFDRSTANYAAMLWLLTPGVLRFFILQVTYNTVMILFWSLSFYCFINLITQKRTRDYYYCGMSIGLLLLSHYVGALLVVSLLLASLYYRPYRFIFKSIHFYLGTSIACLLFSPVLIWNYQHHWASFAYQLGHGFHKTASTQHVTQIASYLFNHIISYNLCFIALWVMIWRKRQSILKSTIYGVLLFPTIFVFVFFLISAYFSPTQRNWSAPFFYTGAILVASYLAPLHDRIFKPYLKKKYFYPIIVAGLGVLISGLPKTLITHQGPWGAVSATQDMLHKIPPQLYQNKPIFVSNLDLGAAAAYFLLPHPIIYAMTIDAGHQYYYWWQSSLKQTDSNTTKGFIYMSYVPLEDKAGLFKTCGLKKTFNAQPNHLWSTDFMLYLYVYDCPQNA